LDGNESQEADRQRRADARQDPQDAQPVVAVPIHTRGTRTARCVAAVEVELREAGLALPWPGATRAGVSRLPVMNASTVLAGIFVGFVVVALISAMGSWIGPALFALAFFALGALLIVGGEGQEGLLMAGVVLLGAGVIELRALVAFWDASTAPHGPSGAWRTMAVLVGLGGSLGFFVLLMLLAMAVAGFYGQL
jgi:hypothetical protein